MTVDVFKQVIQGKLGAPALSVEELILRWELGQIRNHDLMAHYGVSDKQMFEFMQLKKKLREAAAEAKEPPYEEGTYGSDSCAG